jgi:small subunit ribosomal protein S11
MAKAQHQQQQQPVSAKAAAKKRVVKVDTYGDAHVTASFNNLIVSLTNKAGQVIA